MNTDEAPKIDPGGDVDGSKRERSSIEFPYMDLATATEVAKAVFSRNGGGEVQADELAAELHLSPTSSGFRTRVAAAKTFGLVTSERGLDAFKVTDLGKQALDANLVRKSKADAFLKVQLFRTIYEAFKGGQLPPAAALERQMLGWGVATKQTERARQVFERSAEQAGYFESGRDRLVRPARLKSGDPSGQPFGPTPSPSEEEKPPLDRPRGAGGGAPPDDPNIHPAILGILKILPPPGQPWTMRQRAKWLSSLNNVLGLIYEDDGYNVDIYIEVRSEDSDQP